MTIYEYQFIKLVGFNNQNEVQEFVKQLDPIRTNVLPEDISVSAESYANINIITFTKEKKQN